MRGQYARLDSAWLALREHLDYPDAVRDLLGEAVAAAVLLASTLKFDGSLTLQLQGDGAVRLLVAQCTQDFRVRAMALFDAARVRSDFRALTGDGQILVTVETGGSGASYQGVVPLAGESLAACLDSYFTQSEQLPTRLRLSANAHCAAGLLIQRIPDSGGTAAATGAAGATPVVSDDDVSTAAQWAGAQAALAAIGAEELLVRPVEDLARSCFAALDLRLFAPRRVVFQCRCSAGRVGDVLRSLGVDDVRALVHEQGSVTVTCEFCQKPWHYDAIDVEQLFLQAPADVSDSLN